VKPTPNVAARSLDLSFCSFWGWRFGVSLVNEWSAFNEEPGYYAVGSLVVGMNDLFK
jgi:hypothetical protein